MCSSVDNVAVSYGVKNLAHCEMRTPAYLGNLSHFVDQVNQYAIEINRFGF